MMKKISNFSLMIILFAAFALGLSACSGETPTNTPGVELQTEVPEVPEGGETEDQIEDQTEDHHEDPVGESETNLPVEEHETNPIITTSNNVVGVGTYVAAEPYAISAEEEEAKPVEAFIMPYGIHYNMQVYDIEEFDYEAQSYRIEVEGFTFEWALEIPERSNAALLQEHLALFFADVPGDYVLTLTAIDEAGNSDTVSWMVHAATYVGNHSLDSPTERPQCAACHRHEVEAWIRTAHASMFERGLDGSVSANYGEGCISCHTTGYNDLPEAKNRGFDDLVDEYDWNFPDELGEGVYDDFVNQYPKVAALSNIQCEACHGPGSDHSGDGPISKSLEYGVCAQCHAEEPYHNFPQQWELSGHAEVDARAFWYPIGEGREECAHCHSGEGFIDFVAGFTPEASRTGYQVITCAVCHDPHTVFSPYQLRIFAAVVLPDGTELTEFGPSSTCIICHNQRYDPVTSINEAMGTEGFTGGDFTIPHYCASAELIFGTGGYTWGELLPISPHIFAIEDACISCHMAPTPGMDDAGTPDDPSDDIPLPGHQTVGEHTFATISPVDGTENISYCQQCHEDMVSFALEAMGDYDGDGTVETNEAEIDGLNALLHVELIDRGIEFLEEYPYYVIPEGVNKNVLGAVWNYHLLTNNNVPAHNLKYLVSLAQLTFEKLTGSTVPNAVLVK